MDPTSTSSFRSLRPAGLALAAWPALQGVVLWLWGSDRGLVAAIVCAAPALLTLALACTSQQDRRQYIARTLAAAMMALVPVWIWATEPPVVASTTLMVTLVGAHVLAFLGAVLWLAMESTRIEPAPGVAPVTPGLLVARLRSLATLGLPLRVAPTGPAQWTVDLATDDPEGRSHRVLLSLDAGEACVRVRERLSAAGAAPRDADEASMRSPGDPHFDPTRPQAQRVWARVAQATMVEPERLQAVTLRWALRPEEGVAAADAGARDAESLLTLLAALVMRSGWRWQPLLFSRHA